MLKWENMKTIPEL